MLGDQENPPFLRDVFLRNPEMAVQWRTTSPAYRALPGDMHADSMMREDSDDGLHATENLIGWLGQPFPQAIDLCQLAFPNGIEWTLREDQQPFAGRDRDFARSGAVRGRE